MVLELSSHISPPSDWNHISSIGLVQTVVNNLFTQLPYAPRREAIPASLYGIPPTSLLTHFQIPKKTHCNGPQTQFQASHILLLIASIAHMWPPFWKPGPCRGDPPAEEVHLSIQKPSE